MVVITKKKSESKENLFRKFAKIFIEEDIIGQLRKKQFYKKPSLVRREEEKERTKAKTQKSSKTNLLRSNYR